MRNRNDFNLDIISAIDGDIVDKYLLRRFELFHKKKAPKKNMLIPLLAAAACLCLIATAFFFAVTGGTDDRQVPIYRGMTVSTLSSNGSASASYVATTGIRTLSASDEPPLIEDALNVSPDSDLFYAKEKETFYITVHLDNPDNFEIVSFTLNGKKYTSYMFEQGSDLENLILKCEPAQTLGIIEYTIDAIKYIDGEEIKDVEIGGNKTVSVAIFGDSLKATATIKNKLASYDRFSFDVSITDNYGRIAASKGSVTACLRKNAITIDSKSLSVGTSENICFDGLSPATSYTCVIIAEYDMLDGNGFRRVTLGEFTFYTTSLLSIVDIDAGYHDVSFDFAWNSGAQQNSIDAISLYLDNKKVKDVAVNTTEITDLQAGTTYTLKVEYTTNGERLLYESTFKTKAYSVDIAFSKTSATFNKVFFDFIETDENDLGQLKVIEISQGEHFVDKTEDITVRSFEGLLAATNYSVRAYYEYDLKDGKGTQVKIITRNIRTLSGTEPYLNITTEEVSTDYVFFKVQEEDPDGLGNITSIELWSDDTLVKSTNDGTVRSFVGLLSNKVYVIKVTYEYTLNKSSDEHVKSVTVSQAFHTAAYAQPSVNVTDTGYTKDSVYFNFSKSNNDNLTCEVTSIELWLGDVLVKQTDDITVRSFTGLIGARTYTVKINYYCDLRDGIGSVFRSTQTDITTQSVGLDIDPQTGYIIGIGACRDTELYINAPVEGRAFKNNTDIEKVYFGSKVNDIGFEAFSNCFSLKEISFFDDGTNNELRICDHAFSHCVLLEKVVFPDELYYIGTCAFFDCVHLTEIHIKDITSWYDMFFVDAGSSNPLGPSTGLYIDGVLLTDLVVPAHIERIGSCAFQEYSMLESISFEEGTRITEIASHAFSRCNKLTSVTIPKSVTTLGSHVFYECDALESVIFEEGTEIVSIGEYCFAFSDKLSSINLENCSKLSAIGEGIFYGCSSITQLELPEKIVYLPNVSFSDCINLEYITLTKNISFIHGHAFARCKNLIAINYGGSATEWNAIIKEQNWDIHTADYTVNCTDGSISKSD